MSEISKRSPQDAVAVMRSIKDDLATSIARALDPSQVADVLVAGLAATKTDRFLCQRSGEIVTAESEPDHFLRLKAAELLARLSGLGQSRELAVSVEHSIKAAELAARRQRALEATTTTEVTVTSEIVESHE
jgi:hypothetical protein